MTNKSIPQFTIEPLNSDIIQSLQNKLDNKTKPPGSLGKLEEIAVMAGAVLNDTNPVLERPVIVVFAGDHGIAREGVSLYPQEVTLQMVLNFLNGGAAINVLADENGIDLVIVDAGVNGDLSGHPGLVNRKTGRGTGNFLKEPAMSREECVRAISSGAEIVEKIHDKGTNIIGFGEMGIGNTSSASVIMSLICGIPFDECVGRGTGHDDAGVQKKTALLREAMKFHAVGSDPLTILSTFGGFEIAMMCGAMLKSAEKRMIILVDGFIATAAFIAAHAMNENIIEYAVFSHQSDERGHGAILRYLKVEPVLSMNMRLGEGTGAALAYPIVSSAVSILNNMATFESARVSKRN